MVSNKPGSFRETGILDFVFLGISLSVIRVLFWCHDCQTESKGFSVYPSERILHVSPWFLNKKIIFPVTWFFECKVHE